MFCTMIWAVNDHHYFRYETSLIIARIFLKYEFDRRETKLFKYCFL